MKNSILNIISKSKDGLSFSQIKEALQIQSSLDFAKLSKTMDELEEENAIFVVRSKYLLPSHLGLAKGVLRIGKTKKATISDEEGNTFNVVDMPDDCFDKDIVLFKKSSQKQWDEEYVRVFKILQHQVVFFVGTYRLTTRGLQLELDQDRYQAIQYRVKLPKDMKVVDGTKVKLAIEKYGNVLQLRVVEIIGHIDDPGVDISAVLLENDIILEFPQEVKDEVKQISDHVLEEEKINRFDLTGEYTVTIDGTDSKDFDDAVSIQTVPEGWLLKVSIADVSHYAKPGSELDKQAYLRGTSTYVVDRVVPMLPHELSNGICSLNPHVIRLTLTCEMVVAKDGTILSHKEYPSFICSTQRMTYADVNRIFQNDKEMIQKYEYLHPFFMQLKQCANAIRNRRILQGAIEFDTDEAIIKVDAKGRPIDIIKRERQEAEMLIEDCMIAANVCVANTMKEKGIPCLYRIHQEPSIKKIQEFKQLSKNLNAPLITKKEISPKVIQQYLDQYKQESQYPILSKALLRCMQKAKYDPRCLGHYGLAEEEYLHFTSPIRRYPDLVVHRMLRKYVFENDQSEKLQDQAFVEQAALDTSIREKCAVDAERAVTDMKMAEYMESRIGKEYNGVISSVVPFGFYVQLDNLVEGLVHVSTLKGMFDYVPEFAAMVNRRSKQRYVIGQEVKVRVLSANKLARIVDFEIVEKQKRKNKEDKKYGKSKGDGKKHRTQQKGKTRVFHRGRN